jgi:hypothetical protein
MSEQEKIQELERRVQELERNKGNFRQNNDPWKYMRTVLWGILIVFFLLIAVGILQFVSAG